MELLIKPDRFWRRFEELHTSIFRMPAVWNQADALLIVCGKQDAAAAYSKTSTLQEWLIGVELSSTALLIHERGLRIISGKAGCEFLKGLQNKELAKNDLEVELIIRNKADGFQNNCDEAFALIGASSKGKTLGYLAENVTGSFATAVDARIKSSSYVTVEIQRSISTMVSIKQKEELNLLEKSGDFSSKCMKFFKTRLEKIVEDDETANQAKIADQIAAISDKPKKVNSPFKADLIEPCYDPVIQSGGVYNLRPSAQTEDSNLHYDNGTIICSLGFRFRNYCTNLSRTFFFNATKDQRRNYKILTALYAHVLQKLHHGVKLCDVYNEALKWVKKVKPELEGNMMKNLGWGTGIEFRDKFMVIGKRNQTVAKLGMVFCVHIGFKDLIDEEKKNKGMTKACKYSISLADTVQIMEGEPQYMTHFPRKIVDYQIAESEDEEGEEEGAVAKPDASLMASKPGSRVTRSRNQKRAAELEEERKRRMKRGTNQQRLRKKLKAHMQGLLQKWGSVVPDDNDEKEWIDPESYPTLHQIRQFRHGWLSCDMAAETLLCPIYNQAVPFHISTIKAFRVSLVGDRHCFRVTFNCPLSGMNRGRNQPDVYFAHPEASFIKELSYYSANPQYFASVKNQLHELQKEQRQRLKDGKLKPLVKQPNIIRHSGNQVCRLKDLQMKPQAGRSRGSGYLEAHKNGFIYIRNTKNKGPERHFIIYSNIRYAFYQPANKTPAVLLHFHLHNEIQIGKKRTKDIQVWHDVIDRVDETSRHGNWDGARAEAAERKRRLQWNKAFKMFVQKVESLDGFNVSFEIPEMELFFQGVPDKGTVKIYPTKNCLIALDDMPNPFICPISDMQLCHFERVAFSLRNFDCAFVPKDIRKDPVRISTIPRNFLDTVQEFLNLQNVPYTSGTHNLDWKKIMPKIRSDLETFVDNGGWSFLQDDDMVAADEPEEDDDDAAGEDFKPGKDDYVPDEDEWEEEEAGDDDNYGDDDDEDDFEEEEEDDMFEEEEEAEEEGLEWDELEKRATESDRRKDKKRKFGEDPYGGFGGGVRKRGRW